MKIVEIIGKIMFLIFSISRKIDFLNYKLCLFKIVFNFSEDKCCSCVFFLKIFVYLRIDDCL